MPSTKKGRPKAKGMQNGTEFSGRPIDCDSTMRGEHLDGSSFRSDLWEDTEQRSAFSPYKPITVLTNLQRGNMRTEAVVTEPVDVSIHHAVGQGELKQDDVIKVSLAELNAKDQYGLTPLMWGCSYGQLPSVKILIQRGVDVNIEGPTGETCLHSAASNGHHEILHLLIAAGANVNHVDEIGTTPLMFACYNDHPNCVNELLQVGADVTVTNENNDTAYSIAAKRGSRLAQAVLENHMLSLFGETPTAS